MGFKEKKDRGNSTRSRSKGFSKKSKFSKKKILIQDTKFASLNSTNIKIIKEYFETIAPNLFDLLAKSNKYVLYQFEGMSHDIFLVPTSMSQIVKKLAKNMPIMHAGIHLGYMRRKRTHTGFVRAFFLSYEGGNFIYNFISKDHPEIMENIQKIQLNFKGEKAFLYGTNIEFENVISNTAKLMKKKLIFVFNKNDNYIGMALLIVKQAGKSKPTEPRVKKTKTRSRSQNFTVSLLNLIDAGYYLRKGG